MRACARRERSRVFYPRGGGRLLPRLPKVSTGNHPRFLTLILSRLSILSLRTHFFHHNNELPTSPWVRHLSSQTSPPSPSSRPRLQSRQEVYAAWNRSLFMYLSAGIIFYSGLTYGRSHPPAPGGCWETSTQISTTVEGVVRIITHTLEDSHGVD